MKMFRKHEGFTLVELMVVVLIIGILVAIAVPIFTAARANAQKKACLSNMRTIDGAATQYQADSDTSALPANIAALVPTYLTKAPVCPSTGDDYGFAAGKSSCATHGSVSNPN